MRSDYIVTRGWTTPKGTKVTASITLRLSETLYADGDNVTVECCEMGSVHAEVEGHPAQHTLYTWPSPVTRDDVTYVGAIGKLGLTGKEMSIVAGMESEIAQHPAWKAKQATIDNNIREIAEMDARQTRNGLCPKCHTYCYGDCEAA